MTADSETSSTAKQKSELGGRGGAPDAKKSSSNSHKTTNAASQSPQEVQRYLDLASARLEAYSAQIERLKAENLNLKRTIKHMERRIMRSKHEDV